MTVIFFHKDKMFLHGAIFITHDRTAKRVGTAGRRPVLVNGAALVGNKDTTGPAVIDHGQIKPGKWFSRVLFNDDIVVKQLSRR